MAICLERGADLHTAQLMPLPLTVSCFGKIQIGYTFLVPAYPGSPGKRAVKRVCVCVCVVIMQVRFLYDERTNADCLTCLIDDGMKECHGAALWVYNNATFTDQDFDNITKLNGATKELQTDKV